MKKMKIAISTNGFDEWGGGVDFINHIVNCFDLVNQNNTHDIILLFSLYFATNVVFFC